MKDKQTVLEGAPAALNKPDSPWEAIVEGDSITARWKWMDATFFAPGEVSDETREYAFTVTLAGNGKYKETDKTESKSSGVSMSGGKLKIGGSSQSFIGKTTQKSVTFGVGRDNQTGQTGLVGFKFDTGTVKSAVRAYLADCGWKKAGLFG